MKGHSARVTFIPEAGFEEIGQSSKEKTGINVKYRLMNVFFDLITKIFLIGVTYLVLNNRFFTYLISWENDFLYSWYSSFSSFYGQYEGLVHTERQPEILTFWKEHIDFNWYVQTEWWRLKMAPRPIPNVIASVNADADARCEQALSVERFASRAFLSESKVTYSGDWHWQCKTNSSFLCRSDSNDFLFTVVVQENIVESSLWQWYICYMPRMLHEDIVKTS